MPLYKFECSQCHEKAEKLMSYDATFNVTCECGGVMNRIISAPKIMLDGTNPDFPGAYDKWARDREKAAERNKKKSYYEG